VFKRPGQKPTAWSYERLLLAFFFFGWRNANCDQVSGAADALC
jgi:hypothetical protein